MNKIITYFAAAIVWCGIAMAAGDPLPLRRVKLETAVRDEAALTVIESNALVAVKDDPGHLRIGDGTTIGGWRVTGPDVSTNLVPYYYLSGWLFQTNKLVGGGPTATNIGPYVTIYAPVELRSNVYVRNARLYRESTLTNATFAPAAGPGISVPFTLTNDGQTAQTTVNWSGHTRLRIVTTNSYQRPSGYIDILDGTNLVTTFYPLCNGSTQTIDYAYQSPSNILSFVLRTIPDPSTNGPVTVTYARFDTMADTSMVGVTMDSANQIFTGDDATAPRQFVNKRTMDAADEAVLDLAVGEIAEATFNRDMNGKIMRWNPRFDMWAGPESNGNFVLSYGGGGQFSIAGGGTVIPRFVSYLFGTGEVHTLYVTASTAAVFGVETSTNMVEWTNGAAASIIATNWVDAYTAGLTITNAAERQLYFRVIDTFDGEGTGCVLNWSGSINWNGIVLTNWEDIAGIGGGISATTATNIAKDVLGAATTNDLPLINWAALGGGGTAYNFIPGSNVTIDVATTNITINANPQAGGGTTNTSGVRTPYIVAYTNTLITINPTNGYDQALYMTGTGIISYVVGTTSTVSNVRLDLFCGTNAVTITSPALSSGSLSTTNVNTLLYDKKAWTTNGTVRLGQ